MKIILINLARARERRNAMTKEFASIGLSFEIHAALDGAKLTEVDYAQVDRKRRTRLGLYPIPEGSIANWLSQREAMRQFIRTEESMMAVFEDDARFRPTLPAVLDLLERKPVRFDLVILERRNPHRKFIPCHELSTGHVLGRVKFADYGSEGYVITREAARHFLEHTPRMVREIDQSISRFWDNGLNVYYIHPPVVYNEGTNDSQIERGRIEGKRAHRHRDHPIAIAWRRTRFGAIRAIQKRLAFRKLLRDEIGVSRASCRSQREL